MLFGMLVLLCVSSLLSHTISRIFLSASHLMYTDTTYLPTISADDICLRVPIPHILRTDPTYLPTRPYEHLPTRPYPTRATYQLTRPYPTYLPTRPYEAV
jgi:hypothetical protein